MKKALLMLVGALAIQTAAYAEQVAGTVTNVDQQGNKLTVRRDDNQQEINVDIKDEAALATVQVGSSVTLDASKGLIGGWEADTVTVSGAATAGTATAGTGTAATSITTPTGATADQTATAGDTTTATGSMAGTTGTTSGTGATGAADTTATAGGADASTTAGTTSTTGATTGA